MIYIRAGLYAEGPSDYDFLLPLLDRLLDSLAASLFPGAYEVGGTAGIDAPRGTAGGRAEKVAAAVNDWWGACTLFVIHWSGSMRSSVSVFALTLCGRCRPSVLLKAS